MAKTLERIAEALERIAASYERQDKARDEGKAHVDALFARQKGLQKLYAQLDARFPGVSHKLTAAGCITDDVADAILAAGDPAAVTNHVLKDPKLLTQLNGLEPEVIRSTIESIEKRTAIASV